MPPILSFSYYNIVSNQIQAPANKVISEKVKIPLAIFGKMLYTTKALAGVLELVDEVDSKSTGGNTVPVRARPPAP